MSATAPSDVAWDLEPLVDGDGPEGVDRQLDEAAQRATALAQAHAGKLAGVAPDAFVAAVNELAAINELIGRAGSYAHLRFATDTADPANGALMQRVQEKATAIETTLLFFELEWAALDDQPPGDLGPPEGPAPAPPSLPPARRYRPHLLSEPEEKILAEKSVTGSSAWSRLFEEVTSTIEVQL